MKDKDLGLCCNCNSILDPKQCAGRHEIVTRTWMQEFGQTALQQTIITHPQQSVYLHRLSMAQKSAPGRLKPDNQLLFLNLMHQWTLKLSIRVILSTKSEREKWSIDYLLIVWKETCLLCLGKTDSEDLLNKRLHKSRICFLLNMSILPIAMCQQLFLLFGNVALKATGLMKEVVVIVRFSFRENV